jgi:Ca2+-binding RTX toxin-like protein
MAVLTVGPGQQFTTLSGAVAAAQDGDVLRVLAGLYENDFATIDKKLTLQGVGGLVHLRATDDIPNDKGILVVNADVTIDHFEFDGARGPSANDAGIRYQGGNLTILNSYFHHNQNGILGNAVPDGSITIRNSEFFYNGNDDPDAGFGTHQIYINNVARLTIDNSYFHDVANIYNHIKSRAAETIITNSRIYDGPETDDWASYEVDVPNGGVLRMENNVIQQSVNSQNITMIEFGAEGLTHATNSLFLKNNVLINDMQGRGVGLYNPEGVAGQMIDTRVWYVDWLETVSGANVSESGYQRLSDRPALDVSRPWQSSPLDGTAAADHITGSETSANYARGFDGDDVLVGGLAYNELAGNVGADTLRGRSAVGDLLMGGQGNDLISAAQSSAHNLLNGNKGNDTLEAGPAGDTLHGGQGDDLVVGGAGADWIYGDLGNDSVSGGGGADVFGLFAGGGRTVVADFHAAEGDRVLLSPGASWQAQQQGADVVVEVTGGGELVLRDVRLESLGAGWIGAG